MQTIITHSADEQPVLVTASVEALGDAFAEWLRRYHEEPERFADEYPDDEEDYGTGCAAYFVKLLGELS
jgi:hypothetical protein